VIKAVIFDMDGLLIDSEPIWREAEKELFSTVGISLSDEMCFETVGLRIEEVVEHWYRLFPWNNKPKEILQEEIIQRVIDLILKKGNALPGVFDCISFFEKKNIPMAIASGSHYRIIQAVTGKLNIQDKMKVIYSAEEEAFGKPHPGIFLTTAKKLNTEHYHCLVFEDSFNGVIAAKAARMKVIAVPEDIHYGEARFAAADLILKHLTEFNEETWQKFTI